MTELRKLGLSLALSLPAILALSPEVPADRVITKDGRMIKPKKARKEGDHYRLIFEHGEILVTDPDLVQSVEIEGDMSDYEPANEDERKKLEQGYVRYRGKWMSKRVYESELRKEYETSKARLEEMAAHSDWSNAWEKETKHFLFRSNTSPEILDFYCDLLEEYYSQMDKRIGIKPTPEMKRTKMVVNIYKSREEFQKLAEPSGPNVLGFFSPLGQTLNFYHNYEEPGESEWVGLHECTHLLTYLIDQQYRSQIWINEAVADYFGSATITLDKKGKPEIETGKLQTDRVLTVQQAIKDGTFTDLEKLFHLEKPEFDGFQYAHAWSFVYFLNNYENGKYRKGFNKFFKDLYTTAKGVPYESIRSWGKTGRGKEVKPDDIKALLLKKIKVKDPLKLEKQWKDYIAAVPLEGPEALLKRGIGATRRGEFEAALDDLNAAIELGSQDPRAFTHRATALALGGKDPESREKAIEDIRKSVELAPLRASYRHRLSQALSGLISFGSIRFEAEELEDFDLDNEEAKMHAGLAMELDPDEEMYEIWFDGFD